MEHLDVAQPDPDTLRFVVRVEPAGGPTTEHDVTLSEHTFAELGEGYETPIAFIEACFRFLLEREPNSSILRTFDVDAIAKYFPEFPHAVRR